MPYSGIYKPRNPDKYKGDVNNIVYRSNWEKLCFMWCDKNSDVVSWSSEETVISYVYDVDKKPHRYFPDLKVQLKDGRTLLIEIKPAKETEAPKYPGRRTKRYLEESLTYVKNQNKWEAARKYCKQRGWEFQVWTEHTLQEMRIMRAPLGKKAMKPLPKMAGFKKKKD